MKFIICIPFSMIVMVAFSKAKYLLIELENPGAPNHYFEIPGLSDDRYYEAALAMTGSYGRHLGSGDAYSERPRSPKFRQLQDNGQLRDVPVQGHEPEENCLLKCCVSKNLPQECLKQHMDSKSVANHNASHVVVSLILTKECHQYHEVIEECKAECIDGDVLGQQCNIDGKLKGPWDICNNFYCENGCFTRAGTEMGCEKGPKYENELCDMKTDNCDVGLTCIDEYDGCNNGAGRCRNDEDCPALLLQSTGGASFWYPYLFGTYRPHFNKDSENKVYKKEDFNAYMSYLGEEWVITDDITTGGWIMSSVCNYTSSPNSCNGVWFYGDGKEWIEDKELTVKCTKGCENKIPDTCKQPPDVTAEQFKCTNSLKNYCEYYWSQFETCDNTTSGRVKDTCRALCDNCACQGNDDCSVGQHCLHGFCGECKTIMSNPDQPCVFPFTWKGMKHEGCTLDESEHPWCGTESVPSEEKGWGICNRYCPVEDTNYEKVTVGSLCSDQRREVTSAEQCKRAGDSLGLSWGGAFDSPTDFPACLYAEDSRNLVYFNLSPNPGRTNVSPKYAAICKKDPITSPPAPPTTEKPDVVYTPTTTEIECLPKGYEGCGESEMACCYPYTCEYISYTKQICK